MAQHGDNKNRGTQPSAAMQRAATADRQQPVTDTHQAAYADAQQSTAGAPQTVTNGAQNGVQQTAGRSARRRGTALGRRLGLMLLLGAALGFALSALGNLLMTSLGLYFNTSDSLPYGLYQATYRSDLKVGFFGLEAQGTVQPLVLTRGDLVLVCLPPSVAAVARERNYVNSGKCAANTAPVGKHIVAQAGDLVAVDAMGVVVNGQLLPQSAPVAQDASGALMPQPHVPLPYQLRAGEYWVLNAKANSFDSRYFGVVTSAEVIATLQPLLTF